MDSSLSYDSHISSVCKSARFQLYRLRRVRKFLTPEAIKLAVHALVTSRLDFSNALLHGLPSYQIARLQLIQNAAARVVSGCSKFEHITPTLVELHWLPISSRITYKLLCLAHKCLYGTAPAYLCSLVRRVSRGRSLRSNTQNVLEVPRTRTLRFGDRSFSCAAPKLWNDLPPALRGTVSFTQFQVRLKTHLFRSAFLEF